MKNPTLVILAAGMGSRFGGLKQIEPVDPGGHLIIDFSLFDAWRAGFRHVVFIITHEMEQEFRKCIGDRMERFFMSPMLTRSLTGSRKGFPFLPSAQSRGGPDMRWLAAAV